MGHITFRQFRKQGGREAANGQCMRLTQKGDEGRVWFCAEIAWKPGGITSGLAVTRAKLVKALMFPCGTMIDNTTGAIILA